MEKKTVIKKATKNIEAKTKQAYNKYVPKKKNPVYFFMGGNMVAFLLSSAAWGYLSNQRSYEAEMHDYTGPVLDQRTYLQAMGDTYSPFNDGRYDPHLAWQFNVCVQLILALICIGIAAKNKAERDKAEQNIDMMLEIERLAKEHKLDPGAAKKMLRVAPEIVKNMSADSRVYFDMIIEGKISVADNDFIGVATAIMAGHLKSHPEDMERVEAVFGNAPVPKEILLSNINKLDKRSK
ncbi:MAG: hypothetical protein IIV74_02185 [Alphaproteobacteria bacterium]|nr:hypothetical protein [Alphaproteobacteria bacterium]